MIRRLLVVMLLGCCVPAGMSYAQTAKQLNDAALWYADQGKYREAIPLLEKSLKLEPKADVYFGLGMCHMLIKQLDEAYKAFQQAVALNPSHVTGYHEVGARYFDPRSHPDQYDRDKAEEILEKALAIDPGHAKSQFILSQVYFSKATIGLRGRDEMRVYHKRAEQALRRALELDPQQADAHVMLGQLYGTRGQKNSAILEFQKALKLNPRHGEAWLYLGMDYYELGLVAESVQALENAQNSRDPAISDSAAKLLKRARAALDARR